ncbi:MAG: DUF4363 family protein [Clostridiales bacterium]|jgi:hypothetical protein|nr:DUF4363 family protein [Clostridiales bacterium]
MKRLYVAAVLLIFSVSISFICYFVLKNHVDNLTTNLNQALEISVNGNGSLPEKTKEIEEIWEDTSEIMHMLIIHTDLSELEVNLLSLTEYSKQKSNNLYNEACIRSIHNLEHIKESLIPDWGNIF